MVSGAHFHPDLERLIRVVQCGDLALVRGEVERWKGTGLCPPRLSLLEARDAQGRRAEDVAEEMAKSDSKWLEIVSYLRGQRLHMDYFE